jgi:chemotaxis protein methyltransferase CheR
MPDLTHVQFEGVPSRRPRHDPGRAFPPRSLDPGHPQPLITGFAADVLATAGLDAAVYRAAPLERRVAACLRTLKAGSPEAASVLLGARPELSAAALSTLLIGVSEFFRDPAVFDVVRSVIIPDLQARPGPVRIWSAGCSTGAELYSMAILLAESGMLDRAWLVGTDCRGDAIAAAREGVFAPAALSRLAPALVDRYFEPAKSGRRIVRTLRRRTIWQVGDVTRVLPDGPWDLVLCRNLVIYLQPHAAGALFGGIHARLSPDGFLVVGKAERPPPARYVPVGRATYRRHDA